MNMNGSLNPAATEALIADFRASKVSFTMWGTKRALNDENMSEAAAVFGANAEFMGASKKLINTKAKAFRGVTAIKSRIARAWQESTLPYPEAGIRLMREDAVLGFQSYMDNARIELLAAVEELDGEYMTLRNEARVQLGTLYNESDYPLTLRGLFDVTWEFPNVTAPEYLRQLNPKLYEQERQRIVARFDEAVTLAEQAFIGEFEGLVSHLSERLTGTTNDGKAKMFKDSTVGNLLNFFDKFGNLSVRSNSQLDTLVAQAKELVAGVEPHHIRPDGGSVTAAQEVMRRHIAENMATIGESLVGMMQDKPRRRVVRRNAETSAA
jgi:hypothetical protein